MEALVESLHIEWKVVLAQAISFVVLLVLLGKYLYRPLLGIMHQREEQIANSLAGAEAQQAKAETLRKDYESHLARISEEARARMEQAAKDAEVSRQRMLNAAQAEIHSLYARHEAQLAMEREQLRRELRDEMSEIAILAASKALRARLTPELQSAVIDQVISELDQPTAH